MFLSYIIQQAADSSSVGQIVTNVNTIFAWLTGLVGVGINAALKKWVLPADSGFTNLVKSIQPLLAVVWSLLITLGASHGLHLLPDDQKLLLAGPLGAILAITTREAALRLTDKK